MGKNLIKNVHYGFKTLFLQHKVKVFIDCAALDRSGFRDIIHILANTHKFKKRMKTLILFLYKINNLFSYKHKRIKKLKALNNCYSEDSNVYLHVYSS